MNLAAPAGWLAKARAQMQDWANEPPPDAEIAYSFDATRGPSQGSQILGIALAKAVERFENNATDKLVKEEYEVLNSDGEPVLSKGPKKGSKQIASKDDDEYEFV